jgi:prevent-host-death family protein
MDTSVRELKARLSHYLKLAARGEPVTVTSRGAPIVRLVQAAPQSKDEEPSRRRPAAVWRLYRNHAWRGRQN